VAGIVQVGVTAKAVQFRFCIADSAGCPVQGVTKLGRPAHSRSPGRPPTSPHPRPRVASGTVIAMCLPRAARTRLAPRP
jgi:hypothetical protein